MLLHLMLNSLLVFFLLYIIVELALFVFQVKHARVRFFCYLLPLIKIPFDICVFIFWEESWFVNLNPLSCEIYVYQLISQWISLPALEHAVKQHLIVPQYLAKKLPSNWLSALTYITLLVAGGGILFRIYQWYSTKKYISELLRSSFTLNRKLKNLALIKELQSYKVKLFQSPKVKVPFAAYPAIIVMPLELENFNDEEFEAMLAHELQHIKWHDPLQRLFITLVTACCWWIPTQGWLNRLLQALEEASDAAIGKYGLNNISLASAINKIGKQRNERPFSSASYLTGVSNQVIVKRVKALLEEHKTSSYFVKEMCAVAISLLAFISFWMC